MAPRVKTIKSSTTPAPATERGSVFKDLRMQQATQDSEAAPYVGRLKTTMSQRANLLARDEIEHSSTAIADHHQAFNSSQYGATTTRP